jgi:hypothetical protein
MIPGEFILWTKLKKSGKYKTYKVMFVEQIGSKQVKIKIKTHGKFKIKIVAQTSVKTIGGPAAPSSLSLGSNPLPVDLFDPLKNLNNACPEQVVLSAASRISSASVDILMEKLLKAYRGKALKDDQIDLFIFFGLKRASDNILAYWGDSAEHLSEGLKTLDPNIVYFLRTGKNGHGGHYQLLYFEAGYWKVYSSPRKATANYVLTDHEGNVTVAGRTLLAEKATWGNKRGNYRYALSPASEDLFSPLMDYIINVRLYGEDYALGQLFE